MPDRDPDSAPSKLGTALTSLSPARIARAIFSRQLEIKRVDKGFKLGFAEDSPAAPPAAPVATGDARMLDELAALLDGVPRSRKVLRHLAAIEHSLRRKDASAGFLYDMAAQPLKVALRQLDALVVGAPSPGLEMLRTRLRDALEARLSRDTLDARIRPVSEFLVDHKLLVSEGVLSDFDKARAAWGFPEAPASEA